MESAVLGKRKTGEVNMAEVEELEIPEIEQSNQQKSSGKAGGKKSNLKINLILILVVQLLLAASGFYVVSNFIEPDPALQKVLIEQAENKKAAAETESGEEDLIQEDGPKEIFLLEDVIVNPAGTRGSRYLSVSVGVEMNAGEGKGKGGHGSAASTGPFQAKAPQLRDALINILSAKTIIQLTSVEEKEQIRTEILESFKEILMPNPVYQIYFVDFVLQ
jgi:flagellar FliL protein